MQDDTVVPPEESTDLSFLGTDAELDAQLAEVERSLNELKLLEPDKKSELFSQIPIDKRCPRGLICLPEAPCKWALNSIYNQGDPHERCEWFIVFGDANYCFFAYQALYGDLPHTLERVAKLTASALTTVNSIQNKAIVKLQKRFPSMYAFLNSEIRSRKQN